MNEGWEGDDSALTKAGQNGARFYAMRLYVAGSAGKGHVALINLRKNPWRAREDQILAVPTLIVESLPGRRIVGDLSDTERVLTGLDLRFDEGAAEEIG